MKLHFAEEFSSYPFGRYEKNNGKNSGETFRRLLTKRFEEAQANGEKLEVVLDDVHGLSGSFLDEAFGKFAKELKEKTGEIVSEKELSFKFKSDMSHYRIYISKIWDLIGENCAPDDKQHVA